MHELIDTERTIAGADAMRAFGEVIARSVRPGDLLLLHGDLGAGKTTLAQGIAHGLGIEQTVTSPTFTIVSEYPVEPGHAGIDRLFHLDLYRLIDPHELESFGFDEYVRPDRAVSLIEWPERAAGFFPPEGIVIEIDSPEPETRHVRIRRLGAVG